MPTTKERKTVIAASISEIKRVMSDGITISSLNAAKALMLSLAEEKHLFPRDCFPVPGQEQIDRTYLIYQEEDGGYALYVNSSLPGQISRPHDHGGSWAIIVAVEGEEVHRVYKKRPVPRPANGCNIEQAGEIVVQPGTGISLLPDGIHSIHAVAEEPLLHLHLYGKAFEHQSLRREYDLVEDSVREFKLEDIGFIEDAR